jgi:putative membrane protein
MNWWCAAQGGAWEWTWQPYLGVWLMVITAVTVRFWAGRRSKHGDAEPQGGRAAMFLLGVLVLWVAADWPIGPLGAGYLLSVHTAQYILFAFVAPPLLIAGTPKQMLKQTLETRWAFRTAWFFSRPLVAFAVFNVVMLATHLPAVVDGLTTSQMGSFAVDMSWLISGLVFWMPILGPLPELEPLPYPGRMIYLIANVFIPTVPAAFLTYARYPIYSLYELAPPVGTLSTVEDQQIAGMIMKIVGGFIVFGTASVLFFKWSKSEGDSLG